MVLYLNYKSPRLNFSSILIFILVNYFYGLAKQIFSYDISSFLSYKSILYKLLNITQKFQSVINFRIFNSHKIV